MAADVEIFQYVGKTIESILDTFVTTTSSNLIGGLQGTVLAATALYFTVFGYMVMGGYVQNTVIDLVKKAATIALILGVAFTAAAYQSNVVEAFRGLESGLANLVYKGSAGNIYQVLDQSFSQGSNLGATAFEEASKCLKIGSAVGWIVIGVVIAIGTLLLTVVGAGYILLAKIAIALLLGIGPLFILCLMFPAVRRFFDAWAGQVVTYTLVIVFMAVIMAFATQIFLAFVSKVNFDSDDQNGIMVALQLLALTACLVIVALQVPAVASALGGGVGLSMLNPLQPASSAFNTLRSGGRQVYGLLNGPKARRDMKSGFMETRGRLSHVASGNTVLNPAYNRRNWEDIRGNWGKGKKSEGEARKG